MDDKALIDAFLERVRGLRLNEREAGAKVGLSHTAVINYQIGKVKRLNAATRRRIEDWLGAGPALESATYRDGAEKVIAEMEAMLSDLRRRLGLPEATPGARSAAVDAVGEAWLEGVRHADKQAAAREAGKVADRVDGLPPEPVPQKQQAQGGRKRPRP